MDSLAGKTALVTGGASGIGLATVERFARRGARVALNYLPDDARGPAAIDRLASAGLQVIGAPGNVARPGEAEAMVATAIEALGRLDFLANNAGTSNTVEPIAPADMDKLTEEFWSTILTTNLIGPFRCTHAAATALRASHGAVCNTASVAGLNMPGSSMAYGASKAGLISLTKNLARALAPQARVNAVAPGFVDTEWTQALARGAQAGVGRAHLAQARLHAGRHRGGDRVSVRRHNDGHRADPGGRWRLFVVTSGSATLDTYLRVTPPRLAARVRSRLADPPAPGRVAAVRLAPHFKRPSPSIALICPMPRTSLHPPLEGEGRCRANARRRGGVNHSRVSAMPITRWLGAPAPA